MPSHRAPAQPCERRENQSCDDARHSDVRPFRGARRNRLQRWDATPARYHCPAARSHRSLLWRVLGVLENRVSTQRTRELSTRTTARENNVSTQSTPRGVQLGGTPDCFGVFSGGMFGVTDGYPLPPPEYPEYPEYPVKYPSHRTVLWDL